MCFNTFNTFLEMHLKHKFGKCTREQRQHFSHCPSPHYNNNFLEMSENYKILSYIRNRGLTQSYAG